MSNKKNSPIACKNLMLIFREAEAFIKAAHAIHRAATNEAIQNREESAIQLTYASFVNHAYAFELYLKCFSVVEKGEYMPGHNLVELFNNLSEESRTRIIKHHDTTTIYGAAYHLLHGYKRKTDFLSLLQESAKAFVDLRYKFDSRPQSEYELDSALEAVKTVLFQQCPSLRGGKNQFS